MDTKVKFSKIYWFTVIFMMICITQSCKKSSFEDFPILELRLVTKVTQYSAESMSIINSNGGSEIFQCGICWSTDSIPNFRNNMVYDSITGNYFTCYMSELDANTTYYVRAFATNRVGTGFSNVVSFKTVGSTVNDIDGNHYSLITIGNQVWMKENLKTTHYRNGDPVLYFKMNEYRNMHDIKDGAYFYNNDSIKNYEIYGNLYNGFAAVDSRKICPKGWHIPTMNDFNILVNTLGGYNQACIKMQETGKEHWRVSNLHATNESGFTALPGGYYPNAKSGYSMIGYGGFWWIATESSDGNSLFSFSLGWPNNELRGGTFSRYYGLSIRCVKD